MGRTILANSRFTLEELSLYPMFKKEYGAYVHNSIKEIIWYDFDSLTKLNLSSNRECTID